MSPKQTMRQTLPDMRHQASSLQQRAALKESVVSLWESAVSLRESLPLRVSASSARPSMEAPMYAPQQHDGTLQFSTMTAPSSGAPTWAAVGRSSGLDRDSHVFLRAEHQRAALIVR